MKKFFIALLIFVVLFFLGLIRLSPTISGGDSAELAGAGATLGIAHSPGYPLYSLLGRIFTFLFPFGNFSYRMNLMSLFFASLTCVLVYLIVLSLSGRILPAIISTFTLSFTKMFWAQSLVSEVFTLNTFFAALLIYILFNYQLSTINYKLIYLFSFLFGLGLGNHHTLVLLLPGFAYFWWKSLSKEQRAKSQERRSLLCPMPYALCFFVLGLSVYLYVPIRSLRQPLFDWEDPQNWQRFWGLVTRARYGTLQLAQGGKLNLDFSLIGKGLFFFFQILNETITPLGTILFFLGLFFLFLRKDFDKLSPEELKDSRPSGIFLTLLLFFSGPFFLSLSGVTTLSPGIRYILERFVTLPLIPAVIILGVGVEWILNRSRALRLGYLLLLFLPGLLLLKNFPVINQRNNFFFCDYGKNVLRNAKDNSIIFSDRADETEFSLAYLLNSEGKRRDLKFIDCNAGVSRSIYGDDYYRVWGKPRLARRETVEKEIIATTKREVYYSTLLPEQTVIPKYSYGLLYKVKPGEEKIYWQDFYFLRKPLENDIRAENLFLSYYNLLGKYFLEIRASKQARIIFSGLKVYGEKKDWLLAIAYLYYRKGYLTEAEKEYKEALKLNPVWPEALCNLGVIYEQKNNPEKAIEFYQRAIRAKPDYPEAYYNIGVIYWKKGEWKKVVKYFEKVLEYAPEHEGARRYLPMAKGAIEEFKIRK